MDSVGQATESFVASIWLERGSNGEPVWRGHIRHVKSAEKRYFEQVRAMLDFMEHVTGVSCRSLTEDSGDKPTAS